MIQYSEKEQRLFNELGFDELLKQEPAIAYTTFALYCFSTGITGPLVDSVSACYNAVQEQSPKRLTEEFDNLIIINEFEDVKIGDILHDGWVVVHKGDGIILITTTYDIGPVTWAEKNSFLENLPDDCFIPSVGMLHMVDAQSFTFETPYWSSTEVFDNVAYCHTFYPDRPGFKDVKFKKDKALVRPFIRIDL
jgi:hypothetical protein